MTGRAAGRCAGNDEAGWTTAPGRLGAFGRRGGGRGLRPGRGRGFYGPGWGTPEATAEERRTAMTAELDALEKRRDLLRREIESLDAGKGGEA